MKTTHLGTTSPRLPHERDESSDSGRRPPDAVMRQAAADAESGKRPTDRGEVTDALYARTLRGHRGDGEPSPTDASDSSETRATPASKP